MRRMSLLILVALLIVVSGAYDKGYRDSGYSGGYRSDAGLLDVNLNTLGQDLIAGVNWSPGDEIDFSGATKWYFDPTIVPLGSVGSETNRGTGTIDDPFFGLGYELTADVVIERWFRTDLVDPQNVANSPVVGAGDVCVLRAGDHGAVEFVGMDFSDYVAFVGMPGEAVLFGNIDISYSTHIYIEDLEFNPANTRNSGYWPLANEHIANDYTDYNDAPWSIFVHRDGSNNYTSSHIIIKDCKMGVSSGDLPAAWDHEDWNSNVVGGIRTERTPFTHYQGNYGVGTSHIFNVQNSFIADGTFPDSTVTVNCNNIFNNDFRYMNGDAVYAFKVQYVEIKGNTFVDTYCSNDDHVVMLDIYEQSANQIIDANNIIISTVRRPKIMDGYDADCAGGPGSCEGHGGGAIHLIGGNTNCVVKNNVIQGNDWKLIELRTLWGSSYNMQVTNNTLTCYEPNLAWESSDSQARIGSEVILNIVPGDPADGDTIQVDINNNICSGVVLIGGTATTNLTTESNNSEYTDLDFTVAGFSDWTAEVDPRLNDLSLTSSSENVDAGTADNAPLVDYAGTCRPYGGVIDIGAYEYDDGGDCGFPALAFEQFASTAAFDSSGNVGMTITAVTNNTSKVKPIFWEYPDSQPDSSTVSWIQTEQTDHSGDFDSGITQATANADSGNIDLDWTDGTGEEYYWLQVNINDGGWQTIDDRIPANTITYNYKQTDTPTPERGELNFRLYGLVVSVPDTSAVAILPSLYMNQSNRVYAVFHADDGVDIVASSKDSELWISQPAVDGFIGTRETATGSYGDGQNELYSTYTASGGPVSYFYIRRIDTSLNMTLTQPALWASDGTLLVTLDSCSSTTVSTHVFRYDLPSEYNLVDGTSYRLGFATGDGFGQIATTTIETQGVYRVAAGSSGVCFNPTTQASAGTLVNAGSSLTMWMSNDGTEDGL